jgi:hypothetical protein
MATSEDIISLAAHQAALSEKADKIIGLAMQLRSALRTAPPNLPLPDEVDQVAHALAVFLASADRYVR